MYCPPCQPHVTFCKTLTSNCSPPFQAMERASADAAEKIEVGSDIRESASPEVTNSGYEKHPRSLLIQRAAGWSVDIL